MALGLQSMSELDRDAYEPDWQVCHVGASRQRGSVARVSLDGAICARTLGYGRLMSVSPLTFANVITSNKIRAIGELAQGDVASALYFFGCEDEITYSMSAFVDADELDEFVEGLTWPQIKVVEKWMSDIRGDLHFRGWDDYCESEPRFQELLSDLMEAGL